MSKRLCAVVASVKNEETFMPFWVRHYSRWFDPQDMWVYDKMSVDRTRQILPVGANIIDVRDGDVPIVPPWPLPDNSIHVRQVIAQLLESYECVLFAESPDDILVPGPHHGCDLRKYLEEFVAGPDRYRFLTCYNIMHLASEPTYDPGRGNLIAQRSTMVRCPQYDNSFLWKEKPWWGRGWHNLGPTVNSGKRLCGWGEKQGPEKQLYNLHIHYADFMLTNARHTSRLASYTMVERENYATQTNSELRSLMNRMIDEPEKNFSDGVRLEIEPWMKGVI
jgi:hypothetical protein